MQKLPNKILFINQASGYLTIDIINAFASEFDELVLLTGSIRIQNTTLNPRVKIRKIIRYNRGSNFRKAISWAIGTMQILLLLFFRYRRYQLIFFTVPPTAYLMALFTRSSYSLIIYDLYPEALLANGLKESGWFYQWWSGMNRKIYHKAHKVYTLSENMKSRVLLYDKRADVKVISNWSAFSGMIPVKKNENKIIKEEGLTEKFIVQYSGNIGVTHNIDTLIDVAERMRNHKEVLFLIIGRGKRSEALNSMITSKGLSNCRIIPFREDHLVYESLCAADLSVVTLSEGTHDISVPSKVYNIMASGVPILAIASLDSGIANLLKQYENGLTFNKENLEGICNYILELKNNRAFWERLSMNSVNASKFFTSDNAKLYLEYYKETGYESI